MFQSAPGLTVGRCWNEPDGVIDTEVFQSAPGLTVGRCHGVWIFANDIADVSIRARPHGRAMHHAVVALFARAGVSIRARPHGRAMPSSLMLAACLMKFQSAPGLTVGRCCAVRLLDGSRDCFNPRPASRSGDACPRPRRKLAPPPFQSAPGLTVGRCIQAGGGGNGVADGRFNPRPASRSGDAAVDERLEIHLAGFQSAPGLTVGRCAAPAPVMTLTEQFQSAPGLTVGRCSFQDWRQDPDASVSIRARPHGRAMPFNNLER